MTVLILVLVLTLWGGLVAADLRRKAADEASAAAMKELAAKVDAVAAEVWKISAAADRLLVMSDRPVDDAPTPRDGGSRMQSLMQKLASLERSTIGDTGRSSG